MPREEVWMVYRGGDLLAVGSQWECREALKQWELRNSEYLAAEAAQLAALADQMDNGLVGAT